LRSATLLTINIPPFEQPGKPPCHRRLGSLRN